MTATAVTPPLNVLLDMTAEEYHADPVPGGSLSSTTAKRMLPPSCPARALYESRHRVEKSEFDVGHYTHSLLLGRGAPLARVPYGDWRSKPAREAREAAYAAGEVPLLTRQVDAVHAMASAVRAHPIAGPLLDPDTAHGVNEAVVVWHDPEYGEQCTRRSMFDRIVDPACGMQVVDLKTTPDASPDALQRAVWRWGYHMQEAFYRDAAAAVYGCTPDDVDFVFVFVETAPPHLVHVTRLDPDLVDIGRARVRRAIDRWVWCRETGVWPGHADDQITTTHAPRWRDDPGEDW
jgi:hypothetical protein